jgi:hypothetical protein
LTASAAFIERVYKGRVDAHGSALERLGSWIVSDRLRLERVRPKDLIWVFLARDRFALKTSIMGVGIPWKSLDSLV